MRYHVPLTPKTKLLNSLRSVFRLRPLEQLLLLTTKGKESTSAFAKLIPPNYTYRAGTIRIVERDGIHYQLDLSDVVDHFIFWDLSERSRTRLYSMLKKDMIVFDIGANMGATALNFSLLTGPKGKVIAFEPDPHNFERAKRNIALNHSNNIELHNIGLGDRKASLKLYQVNENNKGMNRILNEDVPLPFTEVNIEVLNDFAGVDPQRKPDLIKIDVEGYEMNVLKGATAVLRACHPALFIELDDENLKAQNSSAKELLSFLRDLGYEVTHSETNKSLLPSSGFSNCHFDICAIHRDAGKG